MSRLPDVPLPAAGRYPTPDHQGKGVVERAWDGDVWLPECTPAPAGTTLPPHRRHRLDALRHWRLLLGFLVPAAIASALWVDDRHAEHISGIQIAMPVLAALATAVVMVALVLFVGRRVGFDRIPADRRRSILGWGAAAAVVGFAFAIGVELGVPELLGGDPKDQGWSVLAGPAEETGKLLLPAILWFAGRFRVPREGYLLVLVSAGVFGTMESFEYALTPEKWQPARMVLEIMHPLLTGFVAAVAWQAAYRRRSLITAAALGAWVVAMVAHSTNDVIVFDRHAAGLLSFITIVVVVLMYLLQRHSARQLVPPDLVGAVAARWRPAAPRHARAAAPIS